MANIQKKGDAYYCRFFYRGKRRTVTVGKVGEQRALAFAERTEELLDLLARGRIVLPEGVEITDFVLADGRADAIGPVQSMHQPQREPTTLAVLREKYTEARSAGSMEANSLATALLHLRHFASTLGDSFDLKRLSLLDLQRHVNSRRKKLYRGKQLSPATLRMEVSSFRAAWNWAASSGLVEGPFPSKGLVYPKSDEKPPFMTRDEIERRLKPGGLSEAEVTELWECLYLRKEEVAELLDFLKGKGPPWLYPLVAATGYTGARRSEILRMQVGDVDLGAMTILVREKKRSRTQRTTRRVSLTPALAAILSEWLSSHPGGKHLFSQSGVVGRSKKRSGTTGHKSEKDRPSSLKGRRATVRHRESQAIAAVTRDEAHDHFRRAIAGSKWEVLKGFHVLRHSFISCLAAAGIDQRIIDDWTGHSTDEQRRRYRHLVPDVKQKAIASVFG